MKKALKKAYRAGGVAMSDKAAKRIFGKNARLKRNILRVCASPVLTHAVEAGIIRNNRTVEPLTHLGDVQMTRILKVEA